MVNKKQKAFEDKVLGWMERNLERITNDWTDEVIENGVGPKMPKENHILMATGWSRAALKVFRTKDETPFRDFVRETLKREDLKRIKTRNLLRIFSLLKKTEYRLLPDSFSGKELKAAEKLTEGNIDLLTAIYVDMHVAQKEELISQQSRALQEERNKLQAVVNAMEYGLTVQDKDYNIIYQNEVLKKTFGGLGDKCYQVYEGKKKVCEGCPVKLSWKDSKSHTAERKVVMPSGEIAYWENIANPIRDAEGKIISCLEIARNITERKKTEEELQKHRDQLEELVKERTVELQETQLQLFRSARLAAMGYLAAGVAHEVNNPLTIVRLSIDSLMEKPKGQTQINRKLKAMRDEINRAAKVVQSMLVFSRKQDEAQRIPTNLNDLIKNTLESLEHQLTLNNIEITKNFVDSLPKVNLNPQQIQQVILNLINNARDAMPQGGQITIKTYKGRITQKLRRRKTDILKTGQSIVALEISDSGIGMSDEVKEKIFNPFFTTKQEGQGTGLGLSVSYGIIEAHGGDIRVDSEPGKGTTFIVRLPVTK